MYKYLTAKFHTLQTFNAMTLRERWGVGLCLITLFFLHSSLYGIWIGVFMMAVYFLVLEFLEMVFTRGDSK